MILSATFLFNAVGYEGYTPIPRSHPYPGVMTGMNRGFWLSWQEVYRTGEADWTVAENWVNENLRQHLLPVACISGATPPGGQEGRDAYFLELATRFRGRVRNWEIDNEFDVMGHWGYDVATEKTHEIGINWRRGHDIFKAADPRCTVCLGNVQSLGPEGDGLARMGMALDAFAGGPYGLCPDAVGVHVYPGATVPYHIDGVTERLQQARGTMISHWAAGAELWVTEYGASMYDDPQFADMTATAQAAWLRAMAQAMRAGGASIGFWWHFDDPSRENGGFGFDSAEEGKKIWNSMMLAEQAQIRPGKFSK